MKKIGVLLGLVVFLTFSCAKSELESQVSSVSFTPCQQTKEKSNEFSDRIDVEFTDKGVQITYYNFEVTCDFTTVNVTHTLVNGVLRIKQQGSPNKAECLCHTDVSYTIDGISQDEVSEIYINDIQVYCYNENNCNVQFLENPLRVKVINVENVYNEIAFKDIAFAKAIGQYKFPEDEWYSYLEFPAKYENEGFELNLSDNISDEYLHLVSSREDRKSVTVSDSQSKFMFFWLEAYNSANIFIGKLNIRSGNCSIIFIYADRDFTEKGISTYGEEFDCSYKKGWNIVYYFWDEEKQKRIFQTQKPLNENLCFKCYFEIYRL